MTLYEQKSLRELKSWKRRVSRNPSFTSKMASSAQGKINDMIPAKVHAVITAAIKQMVRGVLFGSSYTLPTVDPSLSFEQREELIRKRIDIYKKTAAAEGGITGFGGLWMGLADFPILLGIKLKLLYDIATIYGYDLKDFKERLFILYIFQLTFSSQKHRQKVFFEMENWKEKSATLPEDIHDFEWRTFQQEYRDHLDLAKMAQLIPVIGGVVGLVVNYKLVTRLGDFAMNAYRSRMMEENPAFFIE